MSVCPYVISYREPCLGCEDRHHCLRGRATQLRLACRAGGDALGSQHPSAWPVDAAPGDVTSALDFHNSSWPFPFKSPNVRFLFSLLGWNSQNAKLSIFKWRRQWLSEHSRAVQPSPLSGSRTFSACLSSCPRPENPSLLPASMGYFTEMELCYMWPLHLASFTEHEFSKFIHDAACVGTSFFSMLNNALCACVSSCHFEWTPFGLSTAAATHCGQCCWECACSWMCDPFEINI